MCVRYVFKKLLRLCDVPLNSCVWFFYCAIFAECESKAAKGPSPRAMPVVQMTAPPGGFPHCISAFTCVALTHQRLVPRVRTFEGYIRGGGKVRRKGSEVRSVGKRQRSGGARHPSGAGFHSGATQGRSNNLDGSSCLP